MNPHVIVMLTHNDVTVPNAKDCFSSSADLPVQYWGFKDVGLSGSQMESLVGDFRAAGKTPVLEVVSFDEADLKHAASLAVDCGVEYFTGATFSASVADIVHRAGIQYLPFCGQVGGSPIKLTGSPDEVLDDAQRICDRGADGVDLVAYRYAGGDPVALAKRVVHSLGGEKVLIAGSIDTAHRIQLMHEIGPLGYTIGGALFNGTFKPGGTFRDNLEVVVGIDADCGENE